MKLSRVIVKLLLLVLFAVISRTAYGQEKEYYLGHHAVSLENSFAVLIGPRVNYHYIINPKARFMWMPKASIGIIPVAGGPPYYELGMDMAFGGKNRLVLGLGHKASFGWVDSKSITGDIRYMNFSKKHFFYYLTYRKLYEYTCDCTKMSPFYFDLLGGIGWKF